MSCKCSGRNKGLSTSPGRQLLLILRRAKSDPSSKQIIYEAAKVPNYDLGMPTDPISGNRSVNIARSLLPALAVAIIVAAPWLCASAAPANPSPSKPNLVFFLGEG